MNRGRRGFYPWRGGGDRGYLRAPAAVEDAYKVRLDIFEGPLDLLLYLIRKDEVDVLDVSIERITGQYIEHINAFKMLNIDLAGEFIVMAANLMYLKSRTLLPRPVQPPDADAEEEDPRWELIRQLIEYKKFKEAAGFLARRQLAMENVFPAVPEVPLNAQSATPSGLPEMGVLDLIRAFQKVMARFQEAEEDEGVREIVDDRFTVSDKIESLLLAVPPGESVPFLSLFEAASTREEVIVTFVALLELMKLRQFRVTQAHLLGEITIHRTGEALAAIPDADSGPIGPEKEEEKEESGAE